MLKFKVENAYHHNLLKLPDTFPLAMYYIIYIMVWGDIGLVELRYVERKCGYTNT